MAESVTVTLWTEGFCEDFELPARIPLSELYPRLFHVLGELDQEVFRGWTSIVLENSRGGLVDLSATLEDYGVCRGCRLKLERKEEYNDI